MDNMTCVDGVRSFENENSLGPEEFKDDCENMCIDTWVVLESQIYIANENKIVTLQQIHKELIKKSLIQ